MIVNGVDLIAAECRVCENFKRDGFFEPYSHDVWVSECSPGKVAIDIGAYTGVYAIAAAKAGAIAVAYEPNPVVYARLKENVQRNGVTVECHKAAVSDVSGTVPFWFKFDMTSAGRLSEKAGYRETTTKAVLLSEPRPVSVIKLDVEGAELLALRGAEPILRRDRPVVIAEALSVGKQDALAKFMASLGYSFTVADRRNLVFRHG